MAKSLQFNTEPQKESITESQSLECPVPSSFSYLIGQVAETAEEKYRLLEQRDKILRQSEATFYSGLFTCQHGMNEHLLLFVSTQVAQRGQT